jgi:hypothetical protein
MGPDPGQDQFGGPFALFDSHRDVLGAGDGRRRSGDRGPGQRNRILVVAVVVVAVAAAGGALAVLQNHGHARAGAQPTHQASTTAAQSAAPAQGTPAPSGSAVVPPSSGPANSPPVSPTTGGGGSTGVAVAPSAASNPAAPQVVAFLNRYFTAINQHDYAAFAHLLDQQLLRQMPAAAFDSGYATTTDSGETLTGIADTGSGGVAATVTFTSHQQPAESIDDSACTSWAITLYLVPNGTGYLISEPPPGYHASYQAC